MAEAEWNLPTGLLAAIGRVESGRQNPVTGRFEPWPWAINAAGTDRFHGSLKDASEDVLRTQAAGVRSIDVGCFQINLFYHPAAFASLQEAFDPLANARYAARFLTTLRGNDRSWDAAIARYHSAVPEIGEPYRQRVMAHWLTGSTGLEFAPVRPQISAAVAGMSSVRAGIETDPHVTRIGTPGVTRVTEMSTVGDRHVIRIRNDVSSMRTAANIPR